MQYRYAQSCTNGTWTGCGQTYTHTHTGVGVYCAVMLVLVVFWCCTNIHTHIVNTLNNAVTKLQLHCAHVCNSNKLCCVFACKKLVV